MTSASDLNLAAGWYVVSRSAKVRRTPRLVGLLGGSVAVWRDADGVRVGSPSVRFPTAERDGYVWMWHGEAEPRYPLPGPRLGTGTRTYPVFHLEDMTGTTVRRILDNTFDPDHLVALHGLDVTGDLTAEILPRDRADALFGPAEPDDARLCAVFGWPAYTGWLGRLSNVLGLNAGRFELRVAAWPTLQHIFYYADDTLVYHLVLAATPTGEDRSVQHIGVAVARGRGLGDVVRYLVHRAEVTMTARQDMPLFNTMRPGDRHGIYVPGDRPLREFRKFYQRWA